MTNRKIIWDKEALHQFNEAILFIANESIQNAGKVRIEILKATEKLLKNPERYNTDKYKLINDWKLQGF